MGKNICKHTYSKGLILKYIRNSYKSIGKKTNNPI